MADPADYTALRVEAWKKAIEVEEHFNDLQLRLLSFALTFLGAILTLAASKIVGFKDFTFFNQPVSPTTLLLLIGLGGLLACWFADRWYFLLLIGAVECAESIETTLFGNVPERLSTKITDKSKEKLFGSKKLGELRAGLFGGLNIVYIAITVILIGLILIQPWVLDTGS